MTTPSSFLVQQQQFLRPPGSAQPVTDDVNQNIVNKPVSKYNASGVNQNHSGAVNGSANKTAPNINNNSSSTLNNNLANSNISVTFNRGGADVSTVPCGGGNLNNIQNNRTLDYTNYYETNNNATGENKYHLANKHNSAEVSSNLVVDR